MRLYLSSRRPVSGVQVHVRRWEFPLTPMGDDGKLKLDMFWLLSVSLLGEYCLLCFFFVFFFLCHYGKTLDYGCEDGQFLVSAFWKT